MQIAQIETLKTSLNWLLKTWLFVQCLLTIGSVALCFIDECKVLVPVAVTSLLWHGLPLAFYGKKWSMKEEVACTIWIHILQIAVFMQIVFHKEYPASNALLLISVMFASSFAHWICYSVGRTTLNVADRLIQQESESEITASNGSRQ